MRDAPSAKSVGLLCLCSRPGIIWCGTKHGRLGSLAAATLEHLRCPHGGCDVLGLPTDPADIRTSTDTNRPATTRRCWSTASSRTWPPIRSSLAIWRPARRQTLRRHVAFSDSTRSLRSRPMRSLRPPPAPDHGKYDGSAASISCIGTPRTIARQAGRGVRSARRYGTPEPCWTCGPGSARRVSRPNEWRRRGFRRALV